MANKANFARVIAFKSAAKKTGMSYEDVKAAYNLMFTKERELTETEARACKIARTIMFNYKNAQAKAEAPVEATGDAE